MGTHTLQVDANGRNLGGVLAARKVWVYGAPPHA